MFQKTLKWQRDGEGKLQLFVDEGSGYKPYVMSVLYNKLTKLGKQFTTERGVGLDFSPGFTFAQAALKAGYIYEASETDQV